MAYETFEKIEGFIQSINRGDSCCSMMLSLISNSNIVNIVVSGDTTIIDNDTACAQVCVSPYFMMRIFRLRQSIRRSIARRSLLPCGEGSRRCSATLMRTLPQKTILSS